jgi:hypothetical protein
MTEEILENYEHSSGPVFTIAVPYARLTDATPTEGNPCEVTSLVDGTQLVGTIMTIDATDSIAIVNVAPCFIGNWEVRNVLTYTGGNAEATFGAINYGDLVYYDHSATMPAGVYLSTSPLNINVNGTTPNTLFGVIATITSEAAALYPKGGITASTQNCQVMQIGAGLH